jgi:hypothetical protein
VFTALGNLPRKWTSTLVRCPEYGYRVREIFARILEQGIIEKLMESVEQNSAWLTATEGAEYLKVEPRTLMLWARQGKVKGFTLSGARRHVWRFRLIDLDAMLTGPSVPYTKGAQ